MSANNPSPHFKGLGQQMIRALEGSLQCVQVNIHELKWNVKTADGKVQAH